MTKTMKDALLRGRLQQVYKITEWKDGCIYRTKPVGFVVCATDHPCVTREGQLISPSMKLLQEAYK